MLPGAAVAGRMNAPPTEDLSSLQGGAPRDDRGIPSLSSSRGGSQRSPSACCTAAFAHHLLKVPVANVFAIPAHAKEDQLTGEMPPLELTAHRQPHRSPTQRRRSSPWRFLQRSHLATEPEDETLLRAATLWSSAAPTTPGESQRNAVLGGVHPGQREPSLTVLSGYSTSQQRPRSRAAVLRTR